MTPAERHYKHAHDDECRRRITAERRVEALETERREARTTLNELVDCMLASAAGHDALAGDEDDEDLGATRFFARVHRARAEFGRFWGAKLREAIVACYGLPEDDVTEETD